MLREGRASLEAQGDVGDPPAVVLRADEVRDRNAHVVEEHLAEVALAVEGPHRTHLDAGTAHVEDHPGDALVLRSIRVGADEELAVVGDVRARAPDLLAADHVFVALAHGSSAQRGEIGARLGLREPLAPHDLTFEDPRQVEAALLLGPLGDERGTCVRVADEVDADVRRTRRRVLLEVHQLLRRGKTAAAELDGPVQTRVAGVVQEPLPAGVVDAPRRPVTRRWRRPVRRDRLVEPGTDLLAKGLSASEYCKSISRPPGDRSAHDALHFGSRFSTKAAGPSRASLV